ncbi:PqqD family peptide modification chaperone [Sphingobacterium sp. DK4209]|uniref:PqqD family peptide modification chaperone n=1 Tax=Sphingobacterium zhuxiongii TaxID=2662364 RepID=A0A5Q0QEE3_9SPHI|nr:MULTISPECIES: PqqD family protein [unclassified Sphingobacterium]MVZ65747.1 PqqD family peptide modification chaperone [Sphingobacterium sp. DK4209]QGA27946.1 PqqD family peptide modification chaperone [Sphingobacterium sp. dk4302]
MRLKEPFILRRVGKDYLVVDPDQGTVDMSRVFSFNATSAFLMEALKGRDFDLADVANLLMQEYEIDAETAHRDSKLLVNQLKANQVIIE